MTFLSYTLSENDYNSIFPNSIRTRFDVVITLLETLKYLITVYGDESQATTVQTVHSDYQVCVFKEKMCRLVFKVHDLHLHSFSIPFALKKSNGELMINHNSLASPLSMRELLFTIDFFRKIKQLSEQNLGIYEYFAIFDDIEFQSRSEGAQVWQIINLLTYHEDGYLRYDKDLANENGRLHPLYHIDVCYSSHSTFKIGLDTALDQSSFGDLLNTKTDCYYLSKSRTA